MVYSKSLEEHVTHLRVVLETLRKHQYFEKIEKFAWCK